MAHSDDVSESGWRKARHGLAVMIAIIALTLLSGRGVADMLVLVALVVFSAQMGLALLPVIAERLPAPAPQAADADNSVAGADVWLSVHFPVHNEPAHLVISTLAALATQHGAPPYEVIVLDNNTTDPRLWQPVERWCRSQGKPFRFFHRQNVLGAKAGALNIALAESDPRSTHIVVVDADYRVTRDFLRTVSTSLRACSADFLQFPQAFEAGDPVSEGLAMELADYFRRHARLADRGRAMLLTGTLSVIGKPALDAIGGWSARTATEDAETGVRLLRAGYRGRYVDRIVGRGLMAFDMDALKAQRARWTKGNARMLILAIRAEIRQRRLDISELCLIALQLTAWVNLMLPAVILGSVAPIMWFSGAERQAALVTVLSLLTISAATLCSLWPVLRRGRRQRWPGRTTRSAITARLALQPTAAWATIEGMFPWVQTFSRTPKTLRGDAGPACYQILSLGALGVAATGLAELMGPVPISFGLCLFLVALLAWTLAQAVSRTTVTRYAGSISRGFAV